MASRHYAIRFALLMLSLGYRLIAFHTLFTFDRCTLTRSTFSEVTVFVLPQSQHRQRPRSCLKASEAPVQDHSRSRSCLRRRCQVSLTLMLPLNGPGQLTHYRRQARRRRRSQTWQLVQGRQRFKISYSQKSNLIAMLLAINLSTSFIRARNATTATGNPRTTEYSRSLFKLPFCPAFLDRISENVSYQQRHCVPSRYSLHRPLSL